MRALLIDDEPAANAELRTILQKHHPQITIAGEAGTVPDGLRQITDLRPDLIFLDIEMPPSNGFELIRQLPAGLRPEIIFVTSRGDHALRAFSYAALGYVLKPVDNKPLTIAIRRASELITHKNSAERFQTLLGNLKTSKEEDKKISVVQDGRITLIRAGDIVYCRGDDGYTHIHLESGKTILSSYRIGHYGEMLPEKDFLIVHRSWLVNRAYVRGWSGGLELDLGKGRLVPVSRRKKAAVVNCLGTR